MRCQHYSSESTIRRRTNLAIGIRLRVVNGDLDTIDFLGLFLNNWRNDLRVSLRKPPE